MKVAVTVTVNQRTVPLQEVRDRRIAAPFEATARQVGEALERVVCPRHRRKPSDVRIHFDARGVADLKYESCCEALGRAVSRALG